MFLDKYAYVEQEILCSELGILGNDIGGEFHCLSHVTLDLHLAL